MVEFYWNRVVAQRVLPARLRLNHGTLWVATCARAVSRIRRRTKSAHAHTRQFVLIAICLRPWHAQCQCRPLPACQWQCMPVPQPVAVPVQLDLFWPVELSAALPPTGAPRFVNGHAHPAPLASASAHAAHARTDDAQLEGTIAAPSAARGDNVTCSKLCESESDSFITVLHFKRRAWKESERHRGGHRPFSASYQHIRPS